MPNLHERSRKRVLIAAGAVGLALCQLGGFKFVLATPVATRRLHEVAGDTTVRIADFSGLSEGLNEPEIQLSETQLSGAVNVSGKGAALYGSAPLGAAQVQQLAEVISDELVRVKFFFLSLVIFIWLRVRVEQGEVQQRSHTRCNGNS